MIVRALGFLAVTLLAVGVAGGWLADASPLPMQPAHLAGPAPRAVARRVRTNPQTGRSSTYFSVMTYNVADLPWPVGHDRGKSLTAIRRRLAAWRQAGVAPDVVLLQEAFTAKSRRIGRAAGYADACEGPRSDQTVAATNAEAHEPVPGGRDLLKGEGVGKLVSSGLYAFSAVPIVHCVTRAFNRNACAGYDCLANKGVLLLRVALPGVPVPIDIATTHLNSRHSSGVSDARSLSAHHRQIDELGTFIRANRDPGSPLILGGDFNMRANPDRLRYALARLHLPFIGPSCAADAKVCRVAAKGGSWRNSEDLQAFDSGPAVHVTPVFSRPIFDRPVNGETLSDHAAYLVVYRVEWSPQTATMAALP